MSQPQIDPQKDMLPPMPFSNDAEKGILSCFMHNPTDLLEDAKVTIETEAFYHPANRFLYEVLLEFHNAGLPVEYIALSQHLQDKKQIDRIGGQGALAELLDFVPTPTHYGYYKETVLSKHRLRRGINLCTGTIQRAYEYQEDVNEWARQFSEDAVEFYQQVVNGAALQAGTDLGAIHDEMAAGIGVKGIQTGLPWFDRYFGGLCETRLILLGGKKGAGKSSLVRQIGWAIAKKGIPTDMITVEMSKVQYYQCLCCLEGVKSESILRQEFTAYEIDVFKRMRKEAPKYPLRIHDDITTIDEALSRIQLGVLKRNVKVVIVDMPQRLSGDNPKSRERELSGIFWKLKQSAKKHNITILAPIHLNAELGALGAQDCENHADQVVIMAPEKKTEPDLIETREKVLFKITKNRFGPSLKRCLYWFSGNHYQFTEDGETDADIVSSQEAKTSRKK